MAGRCNSIYQPFQCSAPRASPSLLHVLQARTLGKSEAGYTNLCTKQGVRGQSAGAHSLNEFKRTSSLQRPRYPEVVGALKRPQQTVMAQTPCKRMSGGTLRGRSPATIKSPHYRVRLAAAERLAEVRWLCVATICCIVHHRKIVRHISVLTPLRRTWRSGWQQPLRQSNAVECSLRRVRQQGASACQATCQSAGPDRSLPPRTGCCVLTHAGSFPIGNDACL